MTDPAVNLATAARELGKSPSTVRRWIVAGAPTRRLGEAGRSKGSLVCVADLRAWKLAQDGITVQPAIDFDVIANGLLAAYKRGNRGESDPVWSDLCVDKRDAALVLFYAYVSIVRTLTGREPETFPEAMETLHGCAVSRK